MPQRHKFKDKIAVTTLALGLAFGAAAPAIAQDVGGNENILDSMLQAPSQRVSAEQARLASANGIVLHFGDDISVSNEKIIQGGLRLAGYEAQVLRGGPTNRITLCVNEKCGQNPMTVDQAHGLLLVILDKIVPEYKLTSPSISDAPNPD